MPVRRQGRFVRTTPEELNAWLGKGSGKPVHVATDNTDLTAELKRELLFVRREIEKGQALMKKPTIRVMKWLGDIPVEAGCTACTDVTLGAKGASHRPNREEYQKSIQAQFDEHCKAVHAQE